MARVIAPLRQMRLLFWQQIDVDFEVLFLLAFTYIYNCLFFWITDGMMGMGEVYGLALLGLDGRGGGAYWVDFMTAL